jgi:hypothetical protein
MTLELIHAELVRIRESLEARPFAAGAPSPKAGASQGKPEEIPMPSQIVENPGDVQVHFGKNSGKPLSELGERSVAWYAQEPEPRLDSSGKPFPPRPQDVLLRNAARTLFHQKRGTLAGAAVQPPKSSAPVASADTGDESIPF